MTYLGNVEVENGRDYWKGALPDLTVIRLRDSWVIAPWAATYGAGGAPGLFAGKPEVSMSNETGFRDFPKKSVSVCRANLRPLFIEGVLLSDPSDSPIFPDKSTNP